MAREFDAYNENFVADKPDKDGKFAWLVRIYSYAKEPGLITTVKGLSDTEAQGRADAKAAASSSLEKFRRAP